MTQKFHDNETATIALYKYHDFLNCERLIDLVRFKLGDNHDLSVLAERLQDGSYAGVDIDYLVDLLQRLQDIKKSMKF